MSLPPASQIFPLSGELSNKRLRAQSPDSTDGDTAHYPTIERVPFEILSEIFVWTECLFRDEDGRGVRTPWTPAYILCRVSKTWRVVALETPELWTCVTIEGLGSKPRTDKWIERARGRRITLWAMMRNAADINGFLASHAGQIANLCLFFPAKSWNWDRPVAPVGLTWPGIRFGIVSLELQDIVLNTDDMFSLLQTTPCLRRLIANRRFDSMQHILNVPPVDDLHLTTCITHLQLSTGFRDLQDLCDLLQVCPKLKFLSLDFDTPINDDLIDDDTLVDLPMLVAMSIPLLSTSASLFESLHMPILEYMLLGTSLSCQELEHGMQNGALHTKKKVLSVDKYIDFDDLFFLLLRMPYIEELTFNGCQDNLNSFIEFLTTPLYDDTFPLPMLRHLSVEGNHSWRGSLTGFQRRYEGIPSVLCHIPPRLESVNLNDCWVWRGFNAARRLFEKHGTKFSLWHMDVTYKWDDDLKTPEEKEEDADYNGNDMQLMQWDMDQDPDYADPLED